MTDSEKRIYNKYLAVTRSSQGKPFKLRKDFSSFDETDYVYVHKLYLFFKRFSHIDMDEFFHAPFAIYIDNKDFNLKFYTTQRALKVYTLYMQRKASASPDSEDQLYNIKSSLKYISTWCVDNNISPGEYIEHKTNNTYTFLIHLKQHKVNIYNLFAFDKFESILAKIEQDYLEFIIGSYATNLDRFRTKFIKSKLAKELARRGLQLIADNHPEKQKRV